MRLDDVEPLTEAAERASTLVMHELAKFRTHQGAASQLHVSGRILPPESQGLSVGYAPIVGMISIVEDFCVSALRLRLTDALADGTVLMSDARQALIRNVERAWPDRKKALSRWFGFDIQGFQPFENVEAFIEVRNAIAHGLGRLTRRQLGGDNGKRARAQFVSVGVREVAGQLIVSEESVVLCAISARASILAWDRIAHTAALAGER